LIQLATSNQPAGNQSTAPTGEKLKSVEVRLQLYSILREKLPPEAKGKTKLKLKEGTSLAGILAALSIGHKVVISVNGQHETDYSRELRDGDEVKIFSSVGGG
jgi:sulfur carrier protein ThiS